MASKSALMPAEEMAKWTRYLERRGIEVLPGEDVLLESFGYEAMYAGKKLFLRTNPSTSAFYEEAFHAIQDLRGVPATMVRDGIVISRWEFEAQRSLIRNRHRLGIPNDQTRQTIESLRDVYKGVYGK
jgi:hypothetical protein